MNKTLGDELREFMEVPDYQPMHVEPPVGTVKHLQIEYICVHGFDDSKVCQDCYAENDGGEW